MPDPKVIAFVREKYPSAANASDEQVVAFMQAERPDLYKFYTETSAPDTNASPGIAAKARERYQNLGGQLTSVGKTPVFGKSEADIAQMESDAQFQADMENPPEGKNTKLVKAVVPASIATMATILFPPSVPASIGAMSGTVMGGLLRVGYMAGVGGARAGLAGAGGAALMEGVGYAAGDRPSLKQVGDRIVRAGVEQGLMEVGGQLAAPLVQAVGRGVIGAAGKGVKALEGTAAGRALLRREAGAAAADSARARLLKEAEFQSFRELKDITLNRIGDDIAPKMEADLVGEMTQALPEAYERNIKATMDQTLDGITDAIRDIPLLKQPKVSTKPFAKSILGARKLDERMGGVVFDEILAPHPEIAAVESRSAEALSEAKGYEKTAARAQEMMDEATAKGINDPELDKMIADALNKNPTEMPLTAAIKLRGALSQKAFENEGHRELYSLLKRTVDGLDREIEKGLRSMNGGDALATAWNGYKRFTHEAKKITEEALYKTMTNPRLQSRVADWIQPGQPPERVDQLVRVAKEAGMPEVVPQVRRAIYEKLVGKEGIEGLIGFGERFNAYGTKLNGKLWSASDRQAIDAALQIERDLKDILGGTGASAAATRDKLAALEAELARLTKDIATGATETKLAKAEAASLGDAEGLMRFVRHPMHITPDVLLWISRSPKLTSAMSAAVKAPGDPRVTGALFRAVNLAVKAYESESAPKKNGSGPHRPGR